MGAMTSAPFEGPWIPKGAKEGSPRAWGRAPSLLTLHSPVASFSPPSKSQRLAQGHTAGR